jgi:hypothetical protein
MCEAHAFLFKDGKEEKVIVRAEGRDVSGYGMLGHDGDGACGVVEKAFRIFQRETL